MSRWYQIVTDSETWDATGDPYALNVEFDIPVSESNTPRSGCFARVWGIPLQTLLNARNFNNQNIKIYGGMQQGLPLANPGQQGLLVQGKVFPALGNWVGTDMTLDFNVAPGTGESNFGGKHANVIHNWGANTPMQQSIQQTLQTAFPSLTPNVNISQKLKLPYNDYGFYENLGQFATYAYSISKTIMNDPNYLGVRHAVHGSNIYVYDGTQQTNNVNIQFTDLVGQPIWIDVNKVQVKTIMRGDLRVGGGITLPQTLAGLGGNLSSAGGAINQSQASNVIQGSFLIQNLRHTGNFRQPDGLSWITTIEAVQQSQGQ